MPANPPPAQLLPCQRCQSAPEIKSIEVYYETVRRRGVHSMWRVTCACGAIGKCRPTMLDAAAAWNEPWQAFVIAHSPERGELASLVEALRKCVAVIEMFKDEAQLSEGVHTGLRKGTDAPDAPALGSAIATSNTSAWSDAIGFALDPYFSMWGGDEALKDARAALHALSASPEGSQHHG